MIWWVSANYVTTRFQRAALSVGINNLHLHVLRHTYATSLRRTGTGLDIVQDLLGHADPSMTRRYAHIGETQLRVAADSIEGMYPVNDIQLVSAEKICAENNGS